MIDSYANSQQDIILNVKDQIDVRRFTPQAQDIFLHQLICAFNSDDRCLRHGELQMFPACPQEDSVACVSRLQNSGQRFSAHPDLEIEYGSTVVGDIEVRPRWREDRCDSRSLTTECFRQAGNANAGIDNDQYRNNCKKQKNLSSIGD